MILPRRALVIALLSWSTVAFAAAPLSDALTAKRPLEGEYMGLYLMGKKVGYIYTNLKFAPGSHDRAEAVNEFVFKATVGTKTAERYLKDTRIYEAKPGGKLLSFLIEQKGDGGDQTLEGTSSAMGLKVIRKRPNLPNEVLTLPASKETVEDADQARVALKRNAKVDGWTTDATDLDTYRVATTLGPTSTRVIGGLSVKLRQVTTLSEKEKVPADSWVDEEGRMVEISFGSNMKAQLEPEKVAKTFDTDQQVEVFGLTRITLPADPSPVAQALPGEMRMTMTGFPEKFRKDTYRQKYTAGPADQVEVVITALPVKPTTKVRPLADPNGGVNLKSNLTVESDNPQIKEQAMKIVGAEKNAYVAAKLISAWVHKMMVNDYGSSSDRATDVLRTMKGDCTEHALLTVALLRAAGIPAKRVDGVVYLKQNDNVPALYWHEWVEAYVGEWTQLDPTFGQEVADATHFAVGEEGNAEITPLIGQIKVLKVQ